MNYETFKSSTISSIQKYFGNDTAVSVNLITKNNNIQLDGLTIIEPSVNISPTIYLNYYYEDYLAGRSFSAIMDDIISLYKVNLPKENMDLSFFTDYDQVKYKIIYKLIHYENNKALLEEVPHFKFLDLAVVFCCFLPDSPNGNAAILIYNHHLDFWNITADTLYELAIKNTPILLPFEIRSMEDIFQSLPIELADLSESLQIKNRLNAPPAMYVLSNTEKFYGASCILYPDVLANFAKLLNQDLYILPSSIHEVLLVPDNGLHNPSDLNTIIQNVNSTEVLAEEILSDHSYHFKRSMGFIQ